MSATKIALLFTIIAGKPVVYESAPGREPFGRHPYQAISLDAAEQRILDEDVRLWFAVPGGRQDPHLGMLPGPVLCADKDEALKLLREWREGSKKMPSDTNCHRRQRQRGYRIR
jgi:hypothetical protein